MTSPKSHEYGDERDSVATLRALHSTLSSTTSRPPAGRAATAAGGAGEVVGGRPLGGGGHGNNNGNSILMMSGHHSLNGALSQSQSQQPQRRGRDAPPTTAGNGGLLQQQHQVLLASTVRSSNFDGTLTSLSGTVQPIQIRNAMRFRDENHIVAHLQDRLKQVHARQKDANHKVRPADVQAAFLEMEKCGKEADDALAAIEDLTIQFQSTGFLKGAAAREKQKEKEQQAKVLREQQQGGSIITLEGSSSAVPIGGMGSASSLSAGLGLPREGSGLFGIAGDGRVPASEAVMMGVTSPSAEASFSMQQSLQSRSQRGGAAGNSPIPTINLVGVGESQI